MSNGDIADSLFIDEDELENRINDELDKILHKIKFGTDKQYYSLDWGRTAILAWHNKQLEQAVIEERAKIRAIFDTFEWDPTGTAFDEYAARRTPGDIDWARGKNSDFAWSAMQAQGRIDDYIKSAKLSISKEEK